MKTPDLKLKNYNQTLSRLSFQQLAIQTSREPACFSFTHFNQCTEQLERRVADSSHSSIGGDRSVASVKSGLTHRSFQKQFRPRTYLSPHNRQPRPKLVINESISIEHLKPQKHKYTSDDAAQLINKQQNQAKETVF